MRNIKLTIEYDGSRYQGWTRLGKNESTNTISNKIIEVIQKMTGETVELFCGCRTETGVHAYAQIANFKTNTEMKDYEIQHYLNRYLPMDIAVIQVEDVPERFHSQLNAKSKIYWVQTSNTQTVGSYLDYDEEARKKWFPKNAVMYDKTVSEGAGQVRAISRLALNSTIKTGKIRPLYDSIDDLFRKTGKDMKQAMRVVIASTA